jgi:hypothetical protein
MTEYKIQLSEYGTVAHRADVIIEADSEEEAVNMSIEMSEQGEIEFDQSDNGALDGWEYQVENIVEVEENDTK